MRPARSTPPTGGAFSRRFVSYTGLFFDEFAPASAWIRERACVQLPPLTPANGLIVRGEIRPHPDARGAETRPPGLRLRINGQCVAQLTDPQPGPWELRLPVSHSEALMLELRLTGVGLTNFLAWLGRVTGLGRWQRFRPQNKNRQLRVSSIATTDGETIFDFSRRDAPLSHAYVRRHLQLGLNIAGFLDADLGVGESARCMVRAADAAGISAALVPLKLHCKNPRTDATYRARFQADNPHAVNVVHIDPPAARDIDYHHGKRFRADKYNIGYFAWELPEFPDAWLSSFDYFHEIWCPSEFSAAAVRARSPLPVLTLPHAIQFADPRAPNGNLAPETTAALRARFGLPPDRFLFLALFDLNSYSARKNPRAAIEAFRISGLAGPDAALVIKVQNAASNPADFAALQQSVGDLPGSHLLTETLSRADVYALEAACDCFVSLHRSEGFGLAVAECMYLGKPVISTDWSATAEYVDATNGCPVRHTLVTLEQNHGPYAKGSTWAEPDVAHAADYMRRLVADRALGTRLGAAARATIAARFSPAAIGARYRQRLEAIATF